MNTAVMTTNDVLARLKMFKESRQAEYSLRSLGIFGLLRGHRRKRTATWTLYLKPVNRTDSAPHA